MPRSVFGSTKALSESIQKLGQERADRIPSDYSEGTATDLATSWMDDLGGTNNPPKDQRALALVSQDDRRIISIHAITRDAPPTINRTLWRTQRWLGRAPVGATPLHAF